MDVFLAGPFAGSRVVAEMVSGLSQGTVARLDGFRVVADTPGFAAALVEAPGAVAEGIVAGAGAEEFRRLGFLMAAFGAAAVAVSMPGAAGPVQAFVAKNADGMVEDWSPRAGNSHAARLFDEVLSEIMCQFPGRPLAELPGLVHGIGFRAIGRVRAMGSPPDVKLRRDFGADDLRPVRQRVPYTEYFSVEEHQLSHRRFDGGMSEVIERTVMVSGDAVSVVPFDPVRGRVLLIEQFRAAPYARRDPNPWMLEAIAGRCDRLEDLEATARREAVEEAGLELGRIEWIADYYASPGVTTDYVTAFIGEAVLDGDGGVHGLAHEGEDIRSLIVSLAEAFEAMASGEINNGPLLISLLWLQANHERLARLWT